MFSVTAPGASKQELEAIRLAIRELWPELTAGPGTGRVSTNYLSWRFSGRWWRDDKDQWLSRPWPPNR